jgi:hypothetical protein
MFVDCASGGELLDGAGLHLLSLVETLGWNCDEDYSAHPSKNNDWYSVKWFAESLYDQREI